MSATPPPVPCLLGPTGSGKSDVAVHLARQTRGEVISCDAFAVYRGMEILTAAPRAPPDVPHHLVGFLDPAEGCSAARFVAEADRLVEEIRARGRVPWIVGGTALYLRAWLKGLGPRVGRDPGLRERLGRLTEAQGPEALHRLLAERDARRASELHPRDVRRVVRALEIVEGTGRPASAQRAEWRGPDRRPARLLGLARGPEDLAARIQARTRALFAAGVVEEARRLLARPLAPEAREVLGLEELALLLAGRLSEEEAGERIARRTRRFARKQMTFFRSFEGVRWVLAAPGEEPAALAARLLETAALPGS